MFKKKNVLVSILIIFVAAIISFGITAQSVTILPNIFGGRVTNSIWCNCSFNFLLTISPPVPGQFVYQPGTPQFAWNSLPRPGVWTLGIYKPGAVCLMYFGKGCGPVGAPVGTITPIVGTSL